MARVYPGGRQGTPHRLREVPAGDDGFGWADFVGMVRKVADGAEMVDQLQQRVTNPQGQVGVCVKLGAKVARSASISREDFLTLCGLAYDDGPPR